MNENVDETCQEEMEETPNVSLLSLDELGHELNSSTDRDVKEILVKQVNVVGLVIPFHTIKESLCCNRYCCSSIFDEPSTC
jgi:hypothetical protein